MDLSHWRLLFVALEQTTDLRVEGSRVSTPERVATDPRAHYAPQPGARSLPRVGPFTGAGLFVVGAAGPVGPADPSLGAPVVRLARDFIEASKPMKICHALAAIPIVAANVQWKDSISEK